MCEKGIKMAWKKLYWNAVKMVSKNVIKMILKMSQKWLKK